MKNTWHVDEEHPPCFNVLHVLCVMRAGGVNHGGCITEADPLTGRSQSWCATNVAPGFYRNSANGTTSGSCPVAWDTCSPPEGRVAQQDSAPAPVTCTLPAPAFTDAVSKVTAYDCVAYDTSKPGQPAVDQPWCPVASSSGGSPTRAPCVPAGCAPRLLAVCPPRTNSSEAIIACFDQVRFPYHRFPFHVSWQGSCLTWP